jgi:exopolysaccharide biosynthesis polyprenyl glycosylphosphotransferase
VSSGAGPRALQASEHRILLACGDLVAASAGVAIAIWIWSITAGFPFTLAFLAARARWFLAAPAWMLALLPSHTVRTALSTRATAAALLRGLALLLALYLALYFFLPPRALPRLVAVYILWEGALLVLAWRLLYVWFFSRPEFLPRVAVVGRGARADIALRLLEQVRPAAGVPIGILDLPPEGGSHASPREGGSDASQEEDTRHGGAALLAQIEASGAAEIVLAIPDQPDDTLLDALLQCQERGIRIVTFAQLYEQTLQRVPVQHVDRDWLLGSFSEAIRARDASAILKRAFDLAGALAGLAALAVLAPFMAAAIWLEDRRPVFFSQTRVGRAGAIFQILKFRTMVRDAEDGDGPRGASADDPRVTRVGRLLRRTRLDELPNLVNVLRGEMSLVGPRPERPELVAVLEDRVPFYRTRLMARPGLTGWAQVNQPYADPIASASDKLEYDLYYLKHRTLAFDLWILMRTVGTVLGLKGR